MGLLDIDEEKPLTKEYFEKQSKWRRICRTKDWTVYSRNIRIDGRLNPASNHWMKIGELMINYHFQKQNILQIYFIPKYYHFLSGCEGPNYDQYVQHIQNVLEGYLSKNITDILTLEQTICGLQIMIKEKELDLVEFVL